MKTSTEGVSSGPLGLTSQVSPTLFYLGKKNCVVIVFYFNFRREPPTHKLLVWLFSNSSNNRTVCGSGTVVLVYTRGVQPVALAVL